MEEHGVSKGYLEEVQFVGGETLQLECEQDTEEWNYKQCHLAPPSRGATLQMDRTPHPLTGARLGDSEITAGPFPSSAAMQPQLELEVKGRPFALPVICLVAPPASERAGHPFQAPYGRPPGIIARISALGVDTLGLDSCLHHYVSWQAMQLLKLHILTPKLLLIESTYK